MANHVSSSNIIAPVRKPYEPKLNQFMEDLRSQTTANPFDRRERVWQDLVAFEVSPFNGAIQIGAIRSFDKGKGNASKAMHFLCGLADRYSVRMECDAVPFGTKDMDAKQLMGWYQRAGFKVVDGYLVREPKGVSAEQFDSPKTASQKWYHGTSSARAKQIRETGTIEPNKESSYGADLSPREGCVYIASDRSIAKRYALDHGLDGVVFEVEIPDPAALLPDEDCIGEALDKERIGSDIEVAHEVEEFWLKQQHLTVPDDSSFEVVWQDAYNNMVGSEVIEHFKDTALNIKQRDPELAQRIIEASGKAAHIGALQIASEMEAKVASADKWYHGTSAANAEKILASGEITPGMDQSSGGPAPQPNAVYLTTDLVIADNYADGGVVLEVQVDSGDSHLIPDEDSLGELIESGELNGNDHYFGEVFNRFWTCSGGDPDWGGDRREAVQDLANNRMKRPMYFRYLKRLALILAKDKPEIASQIINDSGKAAHVGPVKVKGVVGKTAGGVRNLSREQAIEMLRNADANGKNKGSDSPDDFRYLQAGRYVVTSLPLSDLDFISQTPDREEFYAAIPGKFPPVYGRFTPRSIRRHQEDGTPYKVNVVNGNHRCSAAELRGDATIQVVMPEADYALFVADTKTEATPLTTKRAYVSPKDAELTVSIDLGAFPKAMILLDLGIPNFTVFSITFPIEGITPDDLVFYVKDACEALLDEVAAFMMSLGYEEEQIVAIFTLTRAALASIDFEHASDAKLHNKDANIRMYEIGYTLPPGFVDATQTQVITASVVKRNPPVRQIKLTPLKPKDTTNSPARVIQLYKNRTLRSMPRPHYVMVYDQKGRGVGALPLAKNWESRLLRRLV